MSTSSNIRVFVSWSEQTVFAGEDIECFITFKNVAAGPNSDSKSSRSLSHNGNVIQGERQRKTAPLKTPTGHGRPNLSISSSRGPAPNRGHRSTLSLNVPSGSVRSYGAPPSWTGDPKTSESGNTHKRSVSIISLNASESAAPDDYSSQRSMTQEPRRHSRGHARAASLQIVPRMNGGPGGGPPSAPIPFRMNMQQSPPFRATSPLAPQLGFTFPERSRRGSAMTSAPSTPVGASRTPTRRQGSLPLPQTFKFPASPSPPKNEITAELESLNPENSPRVDGLERKLSVQTDTSTIPIIAEHTVPKTLTTRVLSASSNMGSAMGTPRSSGEFYSLSNNSTETMASEYVAQNAVRSYPRSTHTRQSSSLLSPTTQYRPPETLMMGYAQINGSFILDGSLVNQAPFEDVKRKGVVGGQGGGVIGVESKKRDSGLLGGFGWGNFGQSLGGLLGGAELSSIKEMRGVASSKSIPLLSTPQSILFVDLCLAAGESKTYKYTFKLPRGLPPSHRGKTIKIAYNLVIGTQRPGGVKEQQVRSVECPFRVLGSVNAHGELLGHDLMSPYILLRDQAQVSTESAPPKAQVKKASPTVKKTDSSLAGFQAYVEELLSRPRENSSQGLLSPTEAPRSRQPSTFTEQEPTTAKDAIDLAILRSNATTQSQQSSNRFEIARSGRRVAVVMLARPAYRLGETITAAIDFTDADIPCYAVHAALETSEKVDHSIALRSDASIHRVTRKVHASHSESSLFARRVIFSPTIPMNATPEFLTSGIRLEWKIRIEFVTPKIEHKGEEGIQVAPGHLLEEISRDERGVILAAAEGIECESFEIGVPLRIYGAFTESTERDDTSTVGLVV